MLSPSIVCSLIICHFLFIIFHVQATSQTANLQQPSPPPDPLLPFIPSIPVHNDTSHDQDGKDHDTEPLKNNGRGSHEASSQNYAAENNGTHGTPIDEFQEMMLNEHNKYRREMCAANLEEDDELHTEAMKRAHSLANGNRLSLPDEYNENDFEIDTGDPSKITSEMIVKTWLDQSKYYNVEQEDSALKYSQLVWKSSKKMGVGHAYDGHKLYVIVLYKPSGNIQGEFRASVGCESQSEQKKST